jgi:Ca2+/H+ antiporter
MLREGHIRLVLASLLGSIFVNLLFILGVAIMSGGYHHREQQYNKKATQMLACFMNMGVLCILIPVSLHGKLRYWSSLLIDIKDIIARMHQKTLSSRYTHASIQSRSFSSHIDGLCLISPLSHQISCPNKHDHGQGHRSSI